jgi:hypothetical protein
MVAAVVLAREAEAARARVLGRRFRRIRKAIPILGTVGPVAAMTNPKLTAQQARERARKASEYVMALRALLGQAMRDELEANKAKREAEAKEARG